ncbi:unnamed protein product [Arabis nemorensis]|uniref:Uncharacterized protein n=1 Tax=Arabis nemorensis TaxID=586526 RepID=A0A565BED3_9BRAS|nr:unnamed protein product [Arabis nemorensis]
MSSSKEGTSDSKVNKKMLKSIETVSQGWSMRNLSITIESGCYETVTPQPREPSHYREKLQNKEIVNCSTKTKEQIEKELLELLKSYRKSMKAKCALPSKCKKDKCVFPIEKSDVVLESSQACGKLILFKPVQPSSIDFFSHVLEEKASAYAQRCFP